MEIGYQLSVDQNIVPIPYSTDSLTEKKNIKKISGITIWFCDVVGFSSKMELSERKALDDVVQVMDVLRNVINSGGGNIVKDLGDGNFAVFNNPINAVHTAFTALTSISKHIENQETEIRIGIHKGHVYIQNYDYFGHAVNVASRLESLAPSNGIAISRLVFKTLPKKVGFHFNPAGKPKLKNITESIEVYISKLEHLQLPDINKFNVRSRIVFYKLFNNIKKAFIILFILLLFFISHLAINHFSPRSDNIVVPINLNRNLAILGFLDCINDMEQCESTRMNLANHLINKNIAIFDLTTPLEMKNLFISNVIKGEKVGFVLSCILSYIDKNKNLNWVLHDTEDNSVIDSGDFLLNVNSDISACGDEIIRAIVLRIYTSNSSYPGNNTNIPNSPR